MTRKSIWILLCLTITLFASCDEEEVEQVSVVAEFTADTTQLNEGLSVSFSDLSEGSPSTWTWSFEGGNPATSTEQNPVVRYDSAGTYQVSLTVSNASSSSSITKEAFIQVVSSLPESPGGFDLAVIHDDVLRQYLLYIPETYTGAEAVPLLFDLHTDLGTRQRQFQSSRFFQVADTANFILVTPESLIPERTSQWNYNNDPEAADDIDFINTLMDMMIEKYNIDTTRIYVAGASGGAVMAFNLACQIEERIAAVVAVIGVMNEPVFNVCNPTRPMPVLQLHGTNDTTIPYEPAVPNTLGYWILENQTSQDAIISDMVDNYPDNNNTVTYFLFDAGTNGVSVEHFRVEGGGHTWFRPPNHDVDATAEAWRFFSKFDLNGRRN